MAITGVSKDISLSFFITILLILLVSIVSLLEFSLAYEAFWDLETFDCFVLLILGFIKDLVHLTSRDIILSIVLFVFLLVSVISRDTARFAIDLIHLTIFVKVFKASLLFFLYLRV